MIETCKHCKETIPEDRARRKSLYCSNNCRKKWERKKWKQINPIGLNLSTGTVGAISELIVGADLMKKGYEVFRALSQSTSCDLAILKDMKLYRVEVRTVHKSITGKIYPSVKDLDNGRSDIMAMVARSDFTITYVPDISTEEMQI